MRRLLPLSLSFLLVTFAVMVERAAPTAEPPTPSSRSQRSKKSATAAPSKKTTPALDLSGIQSSLGGEPVSATFTNASPGQVTLYWIDFQGQRDSRPNAGDRLAPSQSVDIATTDGAAFVVVDDKGTPFEVHLVSKATPAVQIGKTPPARSLTSRPATPAAALVKGRKHPEELKGAKSRAGGAATTISFINNLKKPVLIRWIDYQGKRDTRPAERLLPLKVTGMGTTDGAVFIVLDENENALELHRADMNAWRVEIGGPIVDYAKPPRKYQTIERQGITMQVEQSLSQQDPGAMEKAADRLAANIKKTLEFYPSHSHEGLRSVKLYLMHGPQSPQGGRADSIEYIAKGQPDLIRSLDPAWHHAIILYSASKYAALSETYALKSTIHELAHSYHALHWPQDHPPLQAAYQQAMDKRLYHNVRDTETGLLCPAAYAATNGPEYFAELSACYFYQINYPPIDRARLKTHDPVGYRLIEKLWKVSSE